MYFVCTINMRKERFVSKQGHRQPCKHSKAWILSLQLQIATIMDVIQREREIWYCLPTEHQLLKIIIKTLHGIKSICTVIDESFNYQFENFITFHCSWQMKLKHAGRRENYTPPSSKTTVSFLGSVGPPIQYLMNFCISVKYNKSAPT